MVIFYKWKIQKWELWIQYLENPFLEMKGVNLLSKTHRYDKSNFKPKTVLQELLQVDRLIAIIFADRVITINREYD